MTEKTNSNEIISNESKNYISIIVSTICLIITTNGFKTIMSFELPQNLAKAGHLQFLTNISLFFTIIYYILNILSELIIKNKKFSIFRNNYHAIITSVETIVSLVYWPLRLFFINLILPNEKSTIPLNLDLTIHLLPIVSLLFDYFLFLDPPTITDSQALLTCGLLATAYWFHLYMLLDETSDFPYPFLNVDTQKRIVIFIIISLIAFSSFKFNKVIHRYVVKTFRKGEKALHID